MGEFLIFIAKYDKQFSLKTLRYEDNAKFRQCMGNRFSLRQAADLHKKLFENANSDWRANDIAQKVAEEKQREMDLLLNRYRTYPVPAVLDPHWSYSASDPNSLNPDLDPGFLGNSDPYLSLFQLKKIQTQSGSETLVTMKIRI